MSFFLFPFQNFLYSFMSHTIFCFHYIHYISHLILPSSSQFTSVFLSGLSCFIYLSSYSMPEPFQLSYLHQNLHFLCFQIIPKVFISNFVHSYFPSTLFKYLISMTSIFLFQFLFQEMYSLCYKIATLLLPPPLSLSKSPSSKISEIIHIIFVLYLSYFMLSPSLTF